jgi:hypothetical protein
LQLGGTTRSGIAYFIIRPQLSAGGVAGSVVNQGHIGLENNDLSYPAIAATDSGRGVVAFTVMGTDYYPSAGYAPVDALAGAGDIHIAAAGVGPDDAISAYSVFVFSGPARWGDYGAAVVDGNSIWIGSEYIGQTCTFSEYAADITLTQENICGGTRTLLANWYTRISRLVP